MRRLLNVLVSVSLASSILRAQAAPRSCADHPDVNGPCFEVRGRLMWYNGTPSARLWPTGTRRLLGISEGRFAREGYINLPKELADQLESKSSMFADFTVCPFTDEKPGAMRFVCIQAARNISIRPRGE